MENTHTLKSFPGKKYHSNYKTGEITSYQKVFVIPVLYRGPISPHLQCVTLGPP